MTPDFGIINYGVVLAYLATMLGIGLRFSRRQKTKEDYFLAGRRMPWLPVAMSMFASLTSAMTFMGLPSRAFSENIALIVVCVVSPLLVPVLVLVFYPVYRRHRVTTSYEYIGLRFGPAARYTVSGLFVLARLGWMASVIYAPALALSTATGIPLWLSITLMGVMATAYTVLGGLTAVLWTDVAQFVILVGGALWAAVSLSGSVPDGVAGILHTAAETGRLQVAGLVPSLTGMSIFTVGICFFLQMMQDYGTDQVTVQRMMAIRDDRSVTKAILFNAMTDFVMIALLLFIGLGLFAYYRANPAELGDMKADAVLPHYVATRLPAGIAGLVISAIFAAAMSSMDSGINSLATVIEHDFICPLRRAARDEKHDVRLARLLTLALGAIATSAAFLVQRMEHLVEAYAMVMGLFSAPILALFLLGIVSRRASFAGWLAGAAIAIPATLWLKLGARIHWVYYFPFSFGMTYAVGWLASLPVRREDGCSKRVS